jgi:L-alanine-DL-glutamate epimerase-like enolase superfamily enzyme
VALRWPAGIFIGKALEQPIYNLLGGKYHEKLRSYTYMYPFASDSTHTMWDIRADPKLAAERAAEYVKQGFTAIKFSVRWTRKIGQVVKVESCP